MRVRIILPQFENQQRILPRLARALADGTGWSLGSKADPAADLNYAFPYLAHERVGTRTAAWFTHREDGNRQAKVQIWEGVAKQVDLRLTSARPYLRGLEAYGLTRLVTPPLDREKFRIAPRQQHGRPVVGTSGYVYPGGRKGEDLLALLRDSPVGKTVEWRASGRGWPVPTRSYLWQEMESFYQYLNVYVCSSLIEGVGYGPLEALACGVKVVVPRGVGVFDDLPGLPGIVRYQAGDAADLTRALEQALVEQADPEALRAVTEPYSTAAWVSGHQEAVEALFAAQPAPVVEAVPEVGGQRGLYVVAFGEPSRECALRCIASFRRQMPGVPVALVSDRELGPEDVLIRQAEADVGARRHKLAIYDLAPADWQYVLYLDADTETIKSLDFLFDALADGWELAICKNPQRFALARYMLRPDNHPECEAVFQLWGTDEFMQWNGGVFAFRRCERVKRLFRVWQREWQAVGKRDQPPLHRALREAPVKALWLTNLWNLDPKYHTPEQIASATVLHYPQAARRWHGLIHGRADGEDAWRAVRQWEHERAEARR